MRNLGLSDFKAFENLSLETSNDGNACDTLIYGENGAGKSSIYEAIKLFYFRERLMAERIPANIVGQDREDAIRAFNDGYLSNFSDAPAFSLDVDGQPYDAHASSPDCDVFMISASDIRKNRDRIVPAELFKNAFFKYSDTEDLEHPDFINSVIGFCNDDLKETLHLDLTLELRADGTVLLADLPHNISRSTELDSWFNESKISLTILTLLLNAAAVLMKEERAPLLVLDDVITSLDAGSRFGLLRLLLKRFEKCQIILLTHNAGFFNLTSHLYNNSSINPKTFKEVELYTCLEGHKVHVCSPEKAQDIEVDLDAGADTLSLGNRIRKCFENRMVELSKLWRIGALEETQYVIERIISGKPVYFSTGGDGRKDYGHLISEIESLCRIETIPSRKILADKIIEKIESYSTSEYADELIPIVRELNLLKKTAMHPSSHGRPNPIANVTRRDVEASIVLLKKLEDIVARQQRYFVDIFPL